jgi:conjugal transfer pilus assembly protein TraW
MVIRSLVLSIALAVAGAVQANETGVNVFDIKSVDPALVEQAKALLTSAKAAGQTIPAEDRQWLDELSDRTVQHIGSQEVEPDAGEPQADPKKKHPLGEGIRTLIFVSWSMGSTAIKDIMSLYDGRPSTGIVFRGIPEGMSMLDAMTKMHRLTEETQSELTVLLDPLAFRRHSISAVPAIALEDGETLQVKATGTISTRLVESAVAAPGWQPGADLGVHGPTSEIIEPDLLDVAKQRIEALDTEGMKKRALERFWHVHTGSPLPPVQTPARRLVDPSILIPEDITDRNGNVVQKAGKINPLEMMPFDQKLVVIDPTQQWQIDLAQREYAEHGIGMTVTVMATQIPPTSGWELFNSVQDAIDAPLYLLPADMAARFQILRAPSVVTAEGLMFVVREYTEGEVEGKEDAPL